MDKDFDENCNKLKNKFHECLKKENSSIGNELKFMAKSKINELEKYKLNTKLVDKCNTNELVECLNRKYRLKSIDEKALNDIFSKQYYMVKEIKNSN
jgi:hypothetical protein